MLLPARGRGAAVNVFDLWKRCPFERLRGDKPDRTESSSRSIEATVFDERTENPRCLPAPVSVGDENVKGGAVRAASYRPSIGDIGSTWATASGTRAPWMGLFGAVSGDASSQCDGPDD
jgi:hypothetical protein